MEYNIVNFKNENENNNSKNHYNSHINKSNADMLSIKKKKLIETSKNLTQLEYLEIFNIIENDKCQYSENKNGIFVNLTNVSENTIDKIFNFINFIKHKKEDLIKHEEYVNIVRKNISDNKKTITNSIIENENFNENKNENENYTTYSDDEDVKVVSNYLVFSSDEDEDLENKLSLKKKKNKYSGKKAKMIKSIKDNYNDKNKKNKKIEE